MHNSKNSREVFPDLPIDTDTDANVAASVEVDEKGQAIRMSHTTDENL